MSLGAVERCENGRYVTLLAVAVWLVRGPSVELARQIATRPWRRRASQTKSQPSCRRLAKRPTGKGASRADKWPIRRRRPIIRWTSFWCLQYPLQISCCNHQSIGNNWATIKLYNRVNNNNNNNNNNNKQYTLTHLHIEIDFHLKTIAWSGSKWYN